MTGRRVSAISELVFDEGLDGFVAGQAEVVVAIGCAAVAIFGSLPEQAVIIAQEGGRFHLRLVAEDGITLLAQLFGAEGNGHLDILDIPFGPGAAIHPDAAVLDPLGSGLALQVDGGEDDVGADAVCAMRIGQVGCHEDLMGLDLTQQVEDDLHIGHRRWVLFDEAGLVEGQVEEVDASLGHAVVCAGQTCLATTDLSLDGEDIVGIAVAFLLAAEVGFHLLVFVADLADLAVAEDAVIAVDEVHEAAYFFVAHSNIARGLISHMYLVTLLGQTTDGAAHRDDVIVGMRREDEAALGEGQGSFGALGVVGIGLAARPAGDGMLQEVEDIEIGHVGCAMNLEHVGQTVVLIVLGGNLEDRLAQLVAEPDDGTFDHALGPLAGLSEEPGCALLGWFGLDLDGVGQM